MPASSFFAPQALTPSGWVEGLRLSVEGGRVTTLEQTSDPLAGDVQLKGPLLPGVPNGHSHSFQRAMAGRAEWRLQGADPRASHFWSWREEMYRWALRLRPEAIEAIAALVALEGLKAGFTSVCEFHYLHHAPNGARYEQLDELSARVVQGMRRVGVAVTHLPVLYRHAGFGGQPPLDEQRRFICTLDEYAALVTSLKERFSADPAVRVGLAPHSLRAVSPDDLNALVELWRELGEADTPVHIHISEQRAEVEGALAHLGARPVEWLLNNAPLTERWSLIHATHITAEERRGVAQSGAVVGLCPTTEANLGDGLFPLEPYLQEGGRLSVGSDSNVSASVAEELRWLEYGQRLKHERRNISPYLLTPTSAQSTSAHTGASLWSAAVKGGGLASARPCELKVGDWADWVVLNPQDSALWGVEGPSVVDAWVFASRTPQVRDAFVGGAQVLFEGHHPLEEQLIKEARAALTL